MTHVPPAHTDTDVAVRFDKANVLHTGDVFFNGMYPYVDGFTGGRTEGVIAGAAILITAAALRHAGNPFEAALGLVVGVSIGALWIRRNRADPR